MEKAMAPHSSTLAWKIPWSEEPGGLQSMESLSQTRLSDFTFTFHFHALEKKMATHSSILAWRIPGTGEPSGLPSVGSHRVGHDWSNVAAASTATFKSQLPHVYYHVRIESPVYVWCRIQHAWSWCMGMTQRGVMGREVGGRFMFGNACNN